jgi:FSR family fosmidomycin resistance protein-like MFS transporter
MKLQARDTQAVNTPLNIPLNTPLNEQRRVLAGASLAHLLHDGYTDLLYVLLPVWQTQFGLSFAGLAMMRALYSGTMGGLQVPANRLIARFDPRLALVAATFLAAAGFLLMSLPLGFAGLCAGLVVGGVGGSVQHPRASILVTNAFGPVSRGPLGVYNFAGDLGKSILPAGVALLLPVMAWRPVLGLMALAGLIVAITLMSLLPKQNSLAIIEKAGGGASARPGFGILMIIGALDTSTRMGYLLFLPFLIESKGGSQANVGLGLALLFIGGAFGKATCGWLGQRLGVTWCVIVTEAMTAALIAVTIVASHNLLLILLPLLGIFLNGTSSVLYGTVPELAGKGDNGGAFARFYTAVIGAGGLAPVGYGVIADHLDQTVGVLASAATAALIVPLVLTLTPHLRSPDRA